jgi:hypothetical protein
MTLKTPDEFDTPQEYAEYLSQVQAEKNALAEAKIIAREEN